MLNEELLNENLRLLGMGAFIYLPPIGSQNGQVVTDPFQNVYEVVDESLEKHDPLRYFKDLIRKIADVEEVLFSYQATPSDKSIVHFYSIINNDNKEVRKKIYSAEKELMQKFPQHAFIFDFHVIARRGRDRREVVKSSSCSVLFDRHSNL